MLEIALKCHLIAAIIPSSMVQEDPVIGISAVVIRQYGMERFAAICRRVQIKMSIEQRWG